MDILLVNPPAGRRTRGLKDIVKLEPLALEVLAAAVPDHDVEVLDLQFGHPLSENSELERFRRRVREEPPDLIGVTSTASHTYRVHRLLEIAKTIDPEIWTVVGGQHATLRPEEFRAPYVDAVVLGLGAETFRELVEHLDHGDSPVDVPGLAFPGPEEMQFNRPRSQPSTLADQPLPDRSVTDHRRSDYYYVFVKPAATVRTSQGCSHGCNFCSVRCFTDRHFLPKPREKLVEELERIDEEFVYFADDHTFLNPQRMHEVADALEESSVDKQYLGYTRVDSVVRNPELFRRWSELGLDAVMMGVEAVDDPHLEAMDKGISSDENRRALRILEDCGVGVSAGFVIMPDFTEEDFQGIDRFIEHHPNILTAELTPYTPLPGTPLYEEVEDDLLTTHRELFDLTHFVVPTELPPEELQELIRKYYHRIVSRTLYRLTRRRPDDVLQLHTIEMLGRLLKTSVDYRRTDLDANAPGRFGKTDA